ncbi:MAG TPA: class I SAM-dependent methyltransferase [Polyangiales bacterium]|nr:class I SAM-dependent methyltransferase [Polyangiales bacterium]
MATSKPRPPGPAKRFERPKKPPLRLQTTTLWEYPSQHYGASEQGDQRYVGATPSYVIWNLLQRYTEPGARVVDPMCGSGTLLDVARDLGRRGRGFDLAPYRKDIERADARKLPLSDGEVDLVFIDPPYGDHIHYSDDQACIGKLSAFDDRFYRELRKVFVEARRVLAPGGVLGVYVCDFYNKREGYAPVGFALFDQLAQLFEPIDTVAVVRHNRTLEQGNYHKAAEEQNFFLRGFNYLFIVRKAERRSERQAR